MKLTFWRKPAAPSEEHALSITQTQELHRAAQDALAVATADFDEEPTSNHEKALLVARHELERLTLHMERAERLLEAAKAREAAEARAKVVAEIERLYEECEHNAVRALLEDAFNAEAELLRRVAELRLSRHKMGHELNQKYYRLETLCRSLMPEDPAGVQRHLQTPDGRLLGHAPGVLAQGDVLIRDVVSKLTCDGELAREVANVNVKLHGRPL